MAPSDSVNLEDLVTAHLRGEHPSVPPSQQAEFEKAVVGHAALQGLLDETIVGASAVGAERSFPTVSPEYLIEREIGHGGMGVVYLAHQQSLNRDVALKVLRPGEQTFAPLVKRFLGEAQHLARLRHPNIVSIHEIGDAQGEPYFTMDFIDGEPLSTRLSRGRMSPTQALAILKQVAAGVQHAHREGIIHRDLKPGNVLIDRDGVAFVTDFGLARDISQSSDLTQTGELLGTPQYMSPEQARGQSALIGEATDIHALGLLLFEMLTGTAAFASSSPADVLVRLLHEDPAPLRSLDPRIPRDLETMCQKMLQKSPTARYASVSAVLEDIRRFEAGEPLLARRTGIFRRTIRWVQRHAKVVVAVTGTVLLMLLAVIAAGPLLFDRTSEELIHWAQELHSSGKHGEALQVYRRALAKSQGDQRREILQLMVRCCGELEDAQGLLDAALPILKEMPEASFGRYDYLVAQAVYADTMEEHPHLSASTASDSDEEYLLLESAAKRYQVFLDGSHGSPEERRHAEEQINLIGRFLAAGNLPKGAAAASTNEQELPEGSPEELLDIAGNASVSRWQRGKAAYAAGLQWEQAGDQEKAKQACLEAFDLMRSVFPTYEGISTGTRHSTARGTEIIEVSECGLLRDVFAAVKRLRADVPDMLRGGLDVRIEGADLPAELIPKLRIELYDISLGTTVDRKDRGLPRLVPVRGQHRRVGIADGHYRMTIRYGGATAHSPEASRVISLLVMDFSQQPTELQIQGDTVDVIIPVRLASEITLLEPAAGAAVDLRTDFFRWSAVPDADYYQVTLVKKESRIGEGSFFTAGASVKVASERVCLSTLPEEERRKAESLSPGTTVVWNVQAFDVAGQRIGATVESDRTILLGHGLDAGSTPVDSASPEPVK